jgi:hypothetical protein
VCSRGTVGDVMLKLIGVGVGIVLLVWAILFLISQYVLVLPNLSI